MSKIDFNAHPAPAGPFEPALGGAAAPASAASGAPPAASRASGGGLDFAALGIPVLAAPHPGPLSLEQLVAAIGYEGRQLAVKQGLEAIKMKGDEIKELNDKKAEEIQKHLDALAEREKLSPWLRAFKWIGIVVGAIASAATVAAGVLTANPLLVAGGVVALTMLANSIVSEATDGKVSIGAGVAAVAKACGADETTAKWIGFGFELAVTVVGIVLSVGGTAGAQTAQLAEKIATVVKISSAVSVGSTIAGGANLAAQGALSIIVAQYDNKIALAKAELKDLEAIMERIQTAMKTEDDFLEAVMQRTEDLLGKVKEVVMDNIRAQTAILSGGGGARSLA